MEDSSNIDSAMRCAKNKLFKCPIQGCEMLFKKKYILRDHVRAHNGEKPWTCSYENCKKSFTQLGNLKMHEKTHFSANAYYCTIENCHKAFSARHYLKIHMKSHSGEKPFKCPFLDCNKSYYDRGNLRYHENKFHKIEVADFPFSCIHTNCNKRFKTIKEKLEHHAENDATCNYETESYLELLKNIKNIFHQIDYTGCEQDVSELKINFDKVVSNYKLIEKFKSVVGDEFYPNKDITSIEDA